MIEFIQANISWIAVGALFILMMRMHGSGSGGGCCGGHQHNQEDEPERRPQKLQGAQPGGEDQEQKEGEPVASGNHRHSGGCH